MNYDKKLFDALVVISDKFNQLQQEAQNPEININKYKEINKQIAKYEIINNNFNIYKKLIKETDELLILLEKESSGSDIYVMAQNELDENKEKLIKIEEKLKVLLLPSDPNDDKNIVIELRPAAGGDEASIFVGDLYEIYKLFFQKQGWKIDVLEASANAIGYDYIFVNVTGNAVFSKMKFESGVHRVQRVPETEAKGRIHTSTITVAVMPEVDELEIKIKPEDLIIETCRAGGAGGQHVNRTESAVRIVHKPTGLVATCSDNRSQLLNKERAMKLLYSKIYNKLSIERADGIASNRKDQVGNGERSEKIRTYNYPQNRVTDHRIGLSVSLDKVVEGNLDEIIEALISDDNAKKMSELKL